MTRKNSKNTIIYALILGIIFINIITGCSFTDPEKQSKFVAVAWDNVAYSENGVKWKTPTLTIEPGWSSVCYGKGKFVAVNSLYNKAAYSEDGIKWKMSKLPDEEGWMSVCYGGD